MRYLEWGPRTGKFREIENIIRLPGTSGKAGWEVTV